MPGILRLGLRASFVAHLAAIRLPGGRLAVAARAMSPDEPAGRRRLAKSTFETRSRVRGDTEASFADFFRMEFTAMVALARTICGDLAQAEEIAQEAMTITHRRWDQVQQYERPGAWLRRVTINLATSRRRTLRREAAFLLRRTAAPATPDVESGFFDDEVWAAVRRLPPKQRAAVALFYVEDRSTADIAAVLECSVSAATSQLSTARHRLAAELGRSLDGRGSS